MNSKRYGFTIVELLIVIVIIGILATIVIVAYNGITTKARQATLQSDLTNSRSKLEIANATDGQYPTKATVDGNKSNYVAESKGNTLTYNTNGTTYCVSAIGSDNITYVVSNLAGPMTGSCTGANSEIATAGMGIPIPPAPFIQPITTATCPTARTRVQDARDSHTYWVQKIGSSCWMLTNLAYAGGGTNTYNDTRTLTNGTSDGTTDYFSPKYYIVPSTTNFTSEPADPSTSTDGTGQYGYLYNFCGANGGQAGNGACSSSSSTAVNTAISVCPSGWRLPSSFTTLNNTVNSGSSGSDTGLRSSWLAQYSGSWENSFKGLGGFGYYWSSIQESASSADSLSFYSVHVNVYDEQDTAKFIGYAVRCVTAV